MARLIAVSNRVALPDKGAPTGGLAVGVLAALKSPGGGVWLGWSGKTSENPSSTPAIQEDRGIQFAKLCGEIGFLSGSGEDDAKPNEKDARAAEHGPPLCKCHTPWLRW